MGHSKAVHPPYKDDDQEIMQKTPTKAIEEIMDLYGDEIKRLIYTYVKIMQIQMTSRRKSL
ncbi:hypothetical protein [Virgibacillus sp. L01]|uniref:hypothetical protein n=1 Tax=Virgibacillus sp. L01 TaxID=3457429 RepID=UPI003FD44077